MEMGMGMRMVGMWMRMESKAQARPSCWRHGGGYIYIYIYILIRRAARLSPEALNLCVSPASLEPPQVNLDCENTVFLKLALVSSPPNGCQVNFHRENIMVLQFCLP